MLTARPLKQGILSQAGGSRKKICCRTTLASRSRSKVGLYVGARGMSTNNYVDAV